MQTSNPATCDTEHTIVHIIIITIIASYFIYPASIHSLICLYKVLLCSQGWPWTYHPLFSASQVVVLRACITMPQDFEDQRRVVVHNFCPRTWSSETGAPYEFKASLGFIVSSTSGVHSKTLSQKQFEEKICLFLMYLMYVGVLSARLHTRKEHQVPWDCRYRQLWASTGLLGVELRIFGTAASALNCSAFSRKKKRFLSLVLHKICNWALFVFMEWWD